MMNTSTGVCPGAVLSRSGNLGPFVHGSNQTTGHGRVATSAQSGNQDSQDSQPSGCAEGPKERGPGDACSLVVARSVARAGAWRRAALQHTTWARLRQYRRSTMEREEAAALDPTLNLDPPPSPTSFNHKSCSEPDQHTPQVLSNGHVATRGPARALRP